MDTFLLCDNYTASNIFSTCIGSEVLYQLVDHRNFMSTSLMQPVGLVATIDRFGRMH